MWGAESLRYAGTLRPAELKVTEGAARIPAAGEVLAGKYRLRRLLGEGGMGVVFEAEHLRLRRPIAIKFLNPTMLEVAEIVQRFDREARAAATLRSRHVVRVTDVEHTPEGVPYMVMELLEGGDLEVQREQRGRLPYFEAVDYVLQACGALAEAHDAGIVHRDLKPGNLFLAREDADRVVIKILDFGISKFMNDEDAKLTSAGAIMGTALYMSPEQIRGDISIDARSDIWSVGVILYELITGDAPWLGPTTRVAAGVVAEPAPDIREAVAIPEPLAQAIHSMLEKDPARRPQSVRDVVFAIAPFATPGSVGAEVADHLARRSQRSLRQVAPASSPSLDPSSDPTFSTPSSDRGKLVVSTPANPERSTMAATTTSLNMMIARPRIWGVLAGFAVLALAGTTLIAFVMHRSRDRDRDRDLTSANPPPPGYAAAAPSSRSEPPPPPAAQASEPRSPPTVAGSTPPTSPVTVAVSATATAPKPTPAVSARRPSTVAATPTGAPPKPPTSAKPVETNSVVNPPFLK